MLVNNEPKPQPQTPIVTQSPLKLPSYYTSWLNATSISCSAAFRHPQKSEKIFKVPPQSAFWDATLSRPWKKHRKFMILGYPGTLQMRLGLKREHRFHFWHRSLKRYQKDLQNAPFWAPFGHPGRPNAAFGPFWGQPKISCFFGRVPMLTLARKCSQNGSTVV